MITLNLMELLGLLAAMTALALVPSTSVALVVARSASAGFSHGSAVVAGIVLADLVFVFLAVFGMAALAEIGGGFFAVLRFLAGGYLIWFGFHLLRSTASHQLVTAERSAAKLSSSFLSGLLLTFGDIKAIFFYASLFPVFVDLAVISPLDIAIIAAVTVIAVGGVKLGYAYFATVVVSSASKRLAERGIQVAAGSTMIGAGAYLITKP
jgi:threonine/homoserine/homoserine lactone efflux protein